MRRLWSTATLCVIGGLAGLATFGGGCSPGTEEPQEGTISVAFPSLAAAVAAESVQVQVFDAKTPNACLELVQMRRAGSPLPPALVDRAPVPACDYLGGKTGPLDVGYGKRAFLVTVRGCARTGRPSQECMIGCTLQGVGNAKIEVNVDLTLFSNTVDIPETQCTQLSARCSGACK